MPLTSAEMEQIRELIRYDAAIHTSLSSGISFVIGGLGLVGGWLIARWRRKSKKNSCPICGTKKEVVPSSEVVA